MTTAERFAVLAGIVLLTILAMGLLVWMANVIGIAIIGYLIATGWALAVGFAGGAGFYYAKRWFDEF